MYRRAFVRLGSRSLASLKSSTARSNWPPLKACTPLFSLSRARSLSQPAPEARDATTATAKRIPVWGFRCIPISLTMGCAGQGNLGPAFRRSRGNELLARFHLGGDEPDFFDARAAHDINGASDLSEFDGVVALHERHLFGALLENIFQARTELIPGCLVLVDHHVSARGNLNDDRLRQQGRIFVSIRRRGLRNESVETVRSSRRDHHKDDDEHEKHIDQRNDVRFRHRTFISTNCHPHKKLLERPSASPSRRLRLVAAEEALRSFDSSRSADRGYRRQPSELRPRPSPHRHISRGHRTERTRSCRGGWRSGLSRQW